MAILLKEFCNIYGAETGGTAVMLGGLSGQKSSQQWYCDNISVARFRMECEHGHRGQIMPLCQKHWKQYANGVQFCPRCNAAPPGHKCNLKLVTVS